MARIELPRVGVSSNVAAALVDGVDLGDGEPLVINGRALVTSNRTFAVRLLKEINHQGVHVGTVQVIGGSHDWQQDLTDAARDLGLDLDFPETAAQ